MSLIENAVLVFFFFVITILGFFGGKVVLDGERDFSDVSDVGLLFGIINIIVGGM